jgi:hypothetical protein
MNTTKPVPVSDLSGPALDWAAAHCEGTGKHWLERWNAGVDKRFVYCQVLYNYSTNWGIAGPIIEREDLSLMPAAGEGWRCYKTHRVEWRNQCYANGPSPLIAAMRCYVASRLGDTVEIPEELL